MSKDPSVDSALFAFGQLRLFVAEASQVAEARRIALHHAGGLGFDESASGRLALLVTEASTNLVKHGGGGELLVRALGGARSPGVEVIALDRGAGIVNLGESLRDGFSTSGSPGTGLGAMSRLSTEFDLHSTPGKGTVLRAALWPGGAPSASLQTGVVCMPKAGESACGDAWACTVRPGGATLLVADGLGHGPDAHLAARAAVGVLQAHPDADAQTLLSTAHAALRPTRGAALAVAEVSAARRTVNYAGLGNISAILRTPGSTRHLVSHPGIAGHQARKIQAFTETWSHSGLFVMHSDGLVSHWDLSAYPGLASRHPALIAAVLYRDFSRGSDDVTVLVAREAKQ